MSPLGIQMRAAPATLRLAGFALFLAATFTLTSHASNRRIAAANEGTIETGMPSFVIYGAENLGLSSAPSDLHRLPDGRILVVAQQEFAIGDGVRWELIRHAHGDIRFITERIAVGPDGSLYAGVRNAIARIEFEEDGYWHFGRLAPLNAPANQTLPVLSVVEQTDDAWYWHSRSGNIMSWKPGDKITSVARSDSIGTFFKLGSELYVSSDSSGRLGRLTPSGLAEVPLDTSTPLDHLITCHAPFTADSVLVGTSNAGIAIFNGKSLSPFVSSGLLSGGLGVSDLCSAGEGFYAAALHSYGIVIFNRNGRVVEILDKRIDHRFANVRRLYYTSEGVLWALLGNGIARIGFPSRVSDFNPLITSGLDFVEPCRFEGKLWLLANGHLMRGVYDSNDRLIEFEDKTPAGVNIWRISTETGRMLVSTERGILEYTKDGWVTRVPDLKNAVISTLRSSNGSYAYLARGEIGWLNVSTPVPTLHRQHEPTLPDVYGCDADKNQNIWCELGSARIARLKASGDELKLELYDANQGIPEGWVAIFVLDGVARLNAANRTLVFDEQTGRFAEDKELLARIPAFETASSRPLRDLRGYIWLAGQEAIRFIDDSRHPARILQSDIPPQLRPYDFTLEESGVMWMHDKFNFARYDPGMPEPAKPPLKVIISQVELPAGGRTLFNPNASLPDLPFSENSLIIHYSSPANPFSQLLSFEYKLEGLGTEWVSNGVSNSASFNRLREGRYAFHIRAKTLDEVGPETKLEFSITPPWFRTRAAYAAYAIGGILALAAAIILPIYDERRQKQRLEELVHDRTRELRGSEERYRLLSQELEQRVALRTEELKQRVAEVERLNTDLDRSSAHLQTANNDLQAANQELESFSYSVSHDLRAPLRNVTGFIEILRKRLYGKADKESDRYLDIVIAEAKRLGDLIDELLAFSRIGRTVMKLQPVDLPLLVEQVRLELTHETRGRVIEWQIHPMPRVLGDQFLLRQVFANLIGNAVKFTRRRENAVIEIGVREEHSSDGLLVVYVRDNGAGFNPLYAEKLFKVFQRLHTNRDFEGTGIGLANVKRIITRHGGHAWAVGDVDKGATFFFSIRPAP